jgi:hypothetical protein
LSAGWNLSFILIMPTSNTTCFQSFDPETDRFILNCKGDHSATRQKAWEGVKPNARRHCEASRIGERYHDRISPFARLWLAQSNKSLAEEYKTAICIGRN